LDPEKVPSSPSQNSLWPLTLLGTLLFAFWSSKKSGQINQANSKPVHVDDSTNIKGNAAPRKSPVIAKIPPTPTQYVGPDRRKDDTPPWKEKLEIAAFCGGLALLVVNIGLFIVNVHQSRSTEKAATAAETASETARKQLEKSERPWLKVSFFVQQPGITFKDGGMQLNITPRIENIGHSVATGVVSPMQMFLADDADTMFIEPL